MEIKEGTIWKVKPEWLDKGETPNERYLLVEDRGDRGLFENLEHTILFGSHPSSCYSYDWMYYDEAATIEFLREVAKEEKKKVMA